MNFDAYYSKVRFNYIDRELEKSGKFSYKGEERIKKTASFYGDKLNVYIDTSDGVNEDLRIQEYCGRMYNIIRDSNEKPFLFFKSAYSDIWSKNIEKMAEENGGKVYPFFKWSFNNNFYKHVLGKREEILKAYKSTKKEFDVGVFCGLNPYTYPKPSEENSLISWSDHEKFNVPGSSKNTGTYTNDSRKKIYDKLKKSNFKILHIDKVPYLDYISESFKCKTILNPPGMGEYTSRMVDQSYLGGCIFLRKNSYDNGLTWKNHIPEVDFKSGNWESEIELLINNYKIHGDACQEYFDKCWTPQAIVSFIISTIEKNEAK